VLECLLCKHEALNSNLVPPKKKKRKKNEGKQMQNYFLKDNKERDKSIENKMYIVCTCE
jgi:hypothetical protein